MLKPYKPAHLYTAAGDISKDWYVEYYYLTPGTIDQFKRIKERFDLNRIKTKSERLAYGHEFVKFLNEKLKDGFNPFSAAKVVGNKLEIKIKAQLFQVKSILIEQAPSDYAKNSYTENYNRLIRYIDFKKLEGKSLHEFDLEQVKAFKKYLLDAELAKKTINSTFSYLSGFWEIAIDKRWTTDNPWKSVPRIKRKEGRKKTDKKTLERFEPLTSEEIDKVFPKLREQGEGNFIRYLGMIFYAWARPVEISRLKVQDIEMKRGLIRFKKGETKNNDSAYVQIVPPLMNLLQQMKLEQYPGHYFLFSDGFEPGIRQVSKHYACAKWRRSVKEGIEVNKDMYSLKHTGNIEYLLNNKGNLDLKWQQMQNRHRTSSMTDQYNRKLGVYFIEVGNLNYRHFEP